MTPDLASRVHAAIARPVARAARIGGGAAGSVVRLWFADGSTAVAKTPAPGFGGLDAEARSLGLLARRSTLPVPRVLHAEPTLLVLEDMPGTVGADATTQAHAADLLAALHAVTSRDDPEGLGRFGLSFDNTIGPLPQPNAWQASWPAFFRERRLGPMIERGAREGALSSGLGARLSRLSARLDELVPASPPPSLVHGDVWTGNVLSSRGRITALLDPSPYYGHAEVELAFITLFSTFRTAFFGPYFERSGTPRADQEAFFSTRRHVYNLYPLLVHARLFGASYADQVACTLRGLGF